MRTVPFATMPELLRAAPLARERLPAVESSAWAPFLAECVQDAFAHARDASHVTKRVRTSGAEKVACGASASREHGRLAKAQWHTRASTHHVPYETFAKGLLEEHTVQEQQYIESLEKATCLEALQANVGIWHNAYKLPPLTADRDFVELVFAIPLPPHPEPFSAAHEQASLEAALWMHGPPAAPRPGELRSFLVLSQPIAHAPEKGYVRAYYASVEAVRERAPSETEWMYVVRLTQHDGSNRLLGLGPPVSARGTPRDLCSS